jgi:DNA-directed RNA polymerase subunit RPC12/RpoP
VSSGGQLDLRTRVKELMEHLSNPVKQIDDSFRQSPAVPKQSLTQPPEPLLSPQVQPPKRPIHQTVVAFSAACWYTGSMNPTSEPTLIPPCSRCAATHVVRNGVNSVGTPTFRCRGCGHRFVANPRKGPLSEEKRHLIRRLLLERLSLRALVRVVGVSRSWLQRFVNTLYDQTPWEPGPLKKKLAR